MKIFRSLKTLRSLTKTSRTFLTASTATTTAPLFYTNTTHTHRFLSPLCKCTDWTSLTHTGPLFLSLPPWKLSQSATSLYVRGEGGAVLRKVKELNCLIRNSRGKFPIRLRLPAPPRSSSAVGLDRERSDGGVGLVENWVNLPNFVSVSRLVSGPFIGWMITSEMYSSACVALAISGATDWLDGYLARKMKIDSVVGSYLDPLADKVLIGCVAVAMVQNDLLHPGLVALIVARDALLVGGAVYKRANSLDWKWKSWSDFLNLDGSSPQKVEPLFISKVNTVFQLVLVAAALLQPEFGTQETQLYITYLSWLVASTTAASTAAYGAQYMRGSSVLTH